MGRDLDMTKPVLPRRHEVVVYQVGDATIYVEPAHAGRGLFAIENITEGVTCAVRERDRARDWLTQRDAKFVEILEEFNQ
jgi:hypothetical protein